MKNTQQGFLSIGLLIAIIVGIGVVGGGAVYLGKVRSHPERLPEEVNNLDSSASTQVSDLSPVNKEKSSESSSVKINQQIKFSEGSTDIPDPKNSGVYIYTSQVLGVSFSYEKVSRYNKDVVFVPIETKSSISIKNGDGSVTFYSKNENESVSDAVRRIFLPLEKNKNCDARVVSGERVTIADSRIKLEDVYWGGTNDLKEKYPNLKDICYGNSNYPLYFSAISGTSIKFAYFKHSVQSVPEPFSTTTSKNTYWFQTFKAIK